VFSEVEHITIQLPRNRAWNTDLKMLNRNRFKSVVQVDMSCDALNLNVYAIDSQP
jgi:hypothetical protein